MRADLGWPSEGYHPRGIQYFKIKSNGIISPILLERLLIEYLEKITGKKTPKWLSVREVVEVRTGKGGETWLS